MESVGQWSRSQFLKITKDFALCFLKFFLHILYLNSNLGQAIFVEREVSLFNFRSVGQKSRSMLFKNFTIYWHYIKYLAWHSILHFIFSKVAKQKQIDVETRGQFSGCSYNKSHICFRSLYYAIFLPINKKKSIIYCKFLQLRYVSCLITNNNNIDISLLPSILDYYKPGTIYFL